MSDGLTVRFAAPSHGWIDVTIELPPVVVAFTASYTPVDTVTELAAALLRIAQAETAADVTWNQEPDQMRLEFSRTGEMVEMRIVSVEGHRRATLATQQGSVSAVLGAFADALTGLEGVISDADYARDWRHQFPHDAVGRLRALIT